ncbi:MAG TPA: hypothetical protein RMH85_18015 [Polyangiaceae bacterium LLY-WYZ-15_(1-7)]|nr:hypothetical protein [Polyangiaceae bacterium LLY-WYZ-15_(1-7)]HJL10401.1 hypothetical protein [Polyangiaceae bacterium LLY-WYZ-15_(1-7)]HJL25648.1 hypothetical protein [Polyangiaceae bacterium LLY-WYZ-15_(1-7)]
MPGVDGGPGEDGGVPDDDGGTVVPGDCLAPTAPDPSGTDVWDDSAGRATVAVTDRDTCARTYTLTTTAILRDGRPDNPRIVRERAGDPITRTGNDFFDALHALAQEEVRELSVSEIRDGAFNEGAGVPCGTGGCFETGRLWNYVWTRDTAYAVDLGLAAMDTTRARNSLEFKLSERRGGGDLQIVQDTGTGGSYPISTDRVSWALGAEELLAHLDGADREAFAARAYEALRNTVEHDREVVWDPNDGLYRGEQSFLDWREQTYPEWTAGDVVHIGMSKALNTNLLHYRALAITADLAAEAGESAAEARYRGWADALRASIRDAFWIEEEGLFSTYITTTLDPAPVRRYDLLGSAFAVLFGVASEAQAERILASYPHYGPGAVVVWPQQQDTPIYHNRGEWPFVTAYWLRAAKAARNDAVTGRMVRALMRGAAVNLSNMENFEAATGLPWKDEGDFSGPVVNSQRQLWSVAGYLSMVHHTIFGLEAEADGLHVRPYLTADLRETLFAGTDQLVLNDFPYRGRRVTVVLNLPASGGSGSYAVEGLTLNGAAVTGDLLPGAMLEAENVVEVTLGSPSGAATLRDVDDSDYRSVFGPRTPRITGITESGGQLTLGLMRRMEAPADVSWRIYRDGEVVADELPGGTTSWTDPDWDASSERSPCYTAELTFTASGNHSQHAPAFCWWGPGASRITTIDASAMANVGGTGVTNHGRFHYQDWGDAGHTLTASGFTAAQSGTHLVQVTFGNGAGSINTGITCGHKRAQVIDEGTDEVVGEGFLMMPHLGEWGRWEDSSFVEAELVAGRSYRVVLSGDARSVNMSSFSHFESYTGGLGGSSGVFERVNIAELKLLAR